MPLKFISLFLVLMTALCFSAFAQADYRQGYLLSLENDTIPGLIKYQNRLSGKSSCLFKASESAKPVTYAPGQLNGYGFRNGKAFVSSAAVGYAAATPVFMEYLIGGRISLYHYRTKEKQGEYFVAIKNTEVIELHNALDTVFVNDERHLKVKGYYNRHRYRGQLRALMADRQELFPRVDKVKYNLESLTNLVEKYNSAFGQVDVAEEESLKTYRVLFGLLASSGSTQLYLSDFAYQQNHYGLRFADFNDNSYYAAGAVINVQLRALHEKISFQAEPSIAVMHYGSDIVTGSGSAYASRNVLNFDVTAFKLPLSLKYSFYTSRWKTVPSIRLGVAHQRFLQAKADLSYTVEDPTSSASGKYTDFRYADYQNSVFLAAGADFNMKKNILSAEVIVEGGDGIHEVKYHPFLLHSWTKNLLFQVAYIFK